MRELFLLLLYVRVVLHGTWLKYGFFSFKIHKIYWLRYFCSQKNYYLRYFILNCVHKQNKNWNENIFLNARNKNYLKITRNISKKYFELLVFWFFHNPKTYHHIYIGRWSQILCWVIKILPIGIFFFRCFLQPA